MGCTRAINYSFSFGSLEWQGPAAGASWHDAKRHPSPPPSCSLFHHLPHLLCLFLYQLPQHHHFPCSSPSDSVFSSSSSPPFLSAHTPTRPYTTAHLYRNSILFYFRNPDSPVPCPLPTPPPSFHHCVWFTRIQLIKRWINNLYIKKWKSGDGQLLHFPVK